MEELQPIDAIRSNYKIRPIVIWIVVFLFGLGVYVLRIPVQRVATVFSTGGLLAYAVHALINTKGKSMVINIFFALNIAWFLCLIGFNVFNGGHPLNHRAIFIYLVVAIIWFSGYRIVNVIRKNRTPIS